MIYVYRGPGWAPKLRWGLNVWVTGSTVECWDGITRPCGPGSTWTLHLGRFQVEWRHLAAWEFAPDGLRRVTMRWWGHDDWTPAWEWIRHL